MFHFFHRHHRCESLFHDHHHGHGRGGRGPKMFDAGAMRYVVLQLIADKPRHGYEIIKEIEQLAGGSYTPSPGAIYPLLAMLLDLGHIESCADGNKKLHSITPEGRAFLQENQQMVEAITARLSATPGGERDVRHLMHELKAAIIGKIKHAGGSEAKRAEVACILQRAIDEIAQLD